MKTVELLKGNQKNESNKFFSTDLLDIFYQKLQKMNVNTKPPLFLALFQSTESFVTNEKIKTHFLFHFLNLNSRF